MSKVALGWLKDMGVQTLFIEPGSPWENGYIKSFNGKLRDELLNGEIFDTLWEAQGLVEWWWQEYNYHRPRNALGYKSPVLATRELWEGGSATLRHPLTLIL